MIWSLLESSGRTVAGWRTGDDWGLAVVQTLVDLLSLLLLWACSGGGFLCSCLALLRLDLLRCRAVHEVISIVITIFIISVWCFAFGHVQTLLERTLLSTSTHCTSGAIIDRRIRSFGRFHHHSSCHLLLVSLLIFIVMLIFHLHKIIIFVLISRSLMLEVFYQVVFLALFPNVICSSSRCLFVVCLFICGLCLLTEKDVHILLGRCRR